MERELASGWLPQRGEHGPAMAGAPADPGGLSAMTTPADRVARLAMDARHHLERRDLYRAKAGGPDAVSTERLHELERAYELAAERLAAAEADLPADAHLAPHSVRACLRTPRAARDELPVSDFDMYSPDFVESSFRDLTDGSPPKES
jgi:hypothetical protein